MDATPALDPLGQIPTEVLALLSASNAKRFRAIPLTLKSGTLTLGIVDPNNLEALDTVRFLAGEKVKQIRPTSFSPEVINAAIQKHYGKGDVKSGGPRAGELVAPSLDQSIDLKAESI